MGASATKLKKSRRNWVLVPRQHVKIPESIIQRDSRDTHTHTQAWWDLFVFGAAHIPNACQTYSACALLSYIYVEVVLALLKLKYTRKDYSSSVKGKEACLPLAHSTLKRLLTQPIRGVVGGSAEKLAGMTPASSRCPSRGQLRKQHSQAAAADLSMSCSAVPLAGTGHLVSSSYYTFLSLFLL